MTLTTPEARPKPSPRGTVKVLKRTLKIISDPKHWTQGADARDADGRSVPIGSDEACSHCVDGAFQVAACEVAGVFPVIFDFGSALSGSTRATKLWFAARGRFAAVNDGSVTTFNDYSTHGEVVAALKRAIWARR